jgi:hypothetical protein
MLANAIYKDLGIKLIKNNIIRSQIVLHIQQKNILNQAFVCKFN